MNAFLTVVLVTICLANIAWAGPNDRGFLILTMAEGVEYTRDQDSYCGTGEQDCRDVPHRYDEYGETVILNVSAVFFPNAEPRVTAVTFGLSYDRRDIVLSDWGGCGDFEVATEGWPLSSQGTEISFASPQEGRWIDIYWFAAYHDDPSRGGNRFDLAPHPDLGANFFDDSAPPVVDPIAGLGTFGFNMDGNVPCPGGPFGACCLPEGCFIRLESECTAAGGSFLGSGSDCDPDPCNPVPVSSRSWGQIKTEFEGSTR